MNEYKSVTISGMALRCNHCGGMAFFSRRVQLNTTLANYFNFESANVSADVFACARCGQLHWFLFKDKNSPERVITELPEDYDVYAVEIAGGPLPVQVVEEVDEDCGVESVQAQDALVSDADLAELDDNYDVACIQCGQIIPSGQSACAKCGWTYMP
jgi:DNA-directed RNA polymerase subunit RPC12/RpoP